MIDRFVEAVRRVDPEVTSDELADMIWLAAHMQTGRTQDDHSAGTIPRIEESDFSWLEKPWLAQAPSRQQSSEPHSPDYGTVDVRLPGHHLVSDGPGISARSPALPAIPHELRICRALRSLDRRILSLSQRRPDEVATAEMIAETNLWIPSDSPVVERWLDVALVIDDSASMVVWQRTVDELRTLLVRAGVFRDLRVWRMDGDLRRHGSLSLSGEMPTAVRRLPSELVDPTGRRLVLIVSDCVGRAWATGAVARALDLWASTGPTAIVQMLPQRLWSSCPPEFFPVRMRGLRAGVPNSRLVVESRDSEVSLQRAGLPIPVFELDDRWVKPWALMVSGTAGGWINGTALFTDLLGGSDHEGSGITTLSGDTSGELLGEFKAHASPETYQLAVYLAGAPLSLSVMRLVQQTMLPNSKPSHLAELFLSGLLRVSMPQDASYAQSVDDVEYDFQPGVRDELLAQLSRHDALRVLAAVSRFVSQRLGSPLDFRALLTAGELPKGITDISPPFAQVAYDVLRALGGRYAQAAERLTRMAEIRRLEAQSPVAPASGSRYKHPDINSPGGTPLTSTASAAIPVGSGPGQGLLPRIMRGVPSRNPRFTGRDVLLDNLRKTLINSTEVAALLPHTLHGLGGVGKTQLAIEYIYRYANDYDLICWVPAHDLTEVRTSLVELGAAMGLPDNENAKRAVSAVLDALRSKPVYRRWLLIFDNANRPEALEPYLPTPTGHVLITSRDATWSDKARTVEVDVFARDESITLLKERVPEISEGDADRLADRLGDLPLAVEQAGAWQAESGMSVDEYLRLFDEEFEQLTEHPPTGYPASVGATYRVALDRLRERAPAAAQLLDVCAFFGAEPISVALLWDGRSAQLPAPLAQALGDKMELRAALREIGRYALARVDSINDRITIHRLVQAVVRASLPAEQQDMVRLAAQRILAKANPQEPDLRENWRRHKELSPHIEPCELIQAEEIESRQVVLDQIRYRWSRGDYEGSQALGQITVKAWEERWGDRDILTLLARRHLAVTLRILGDYQAASDLSFGAFERLRDVLGEDHEHTLITADSVAWDLRISGKFNEAWALDKANHERFRNLTNDNHPLTMKAANNLAIDLRWLGRFAEAREADEESVRRRRLVYGNDDKNTQLSVSSLARDLYGLGEYAEGLILQQDALVIQKRMLGPDHAEVLSETRNLVILLRKTGNYVRSLDIAAELVRTYERRFEQNHEALLAARMSYVNALFATGQLNEAELWGRETLKRYQKAFGDEHPVTLACATNLAIILRRSDSPEVALAQNRKSLDAFRRVLGEDHPFTLCCAANMSNDLAGLRQHDAARELSETTYIRSLTVRGPDHPYTFACALNAALDRRATGDEENVEPLLSDALAGFRRKLGESHPETLAASTNRRVDCDIEPPET
jgi:hypothetical protein